MTNAIALVLALAIVAVFLVDSLLFEGQLLVLIGRILVVVVDYLAVWR